MVLSDPDFIITDKQITTISTQRRWIHQTQPQIPGISEEERQRRRESNKLSTRINFIGWILEVELPNWDSPRAISNTFSLPPPCNFPVNFVGWIFEVEMSNWDNPWTKLNIQYLFIVTTLQLSGQLCWVDSWGGSLFWPIQAMVIHIYQWNVWPSITHVYYICRCQEYQIQNTWAGPGCPLNLGTNFSTDESQVWHFRKASYMLSSCWIFVCDINDITLVLSTNGFQSHFFLN